MKPSWFLFIFLTIFLLIRFFEEAAASAENKFENRDAKDRQFGLRIPSLPAFLTLPLTSLAQKIAFVGLKVASLVILILIIATLHNRNRRIDIDDEYEDQNEEPDYSAMWGSYAGLTNGMPYAPVDGKQMLQYYSQQYHKYPPIELQVPKTPLVAPIPQRPPPTKYEHQYEFQYKQPVNAILSSQHAKLLTKHLGKNYEIQEQPQRYRLSQTPASPTRPNRRPGQRPPPKLPKFPKIPPPNHYNPEHYKDLLLPSGIEPPIDESPSRVYPRIKTVKIKLGERPRTPQGYQPSRNPNFEVPQREPRPQSHSKLINRPQTYSKPVQRPHIQSQPEQRPQSFNLQERRPYSQAYRPMSPKVRHTQPSVRKPHVQRPSTQVHRLPSRRPLGQREPSHVSRPISLSATRTRNTQTSVETFTDQRAPGQVRRPMSQPPNARRPQAPMRSPQGQHPTTYINSQTNQLLKHVPRRPHMTPQDRPQTLSNVSKPQQASTKRKPQIIQSLFEQANEVVRPEVSPLDAFGLQPAQGPMRFRPESPNTIFPIQELQYKPVTQAEMSTRLQQVQQVRPQLIVGTVDNYQNERHQNAQTSTMRQRDTLQATPQFTQPLVVRPQDNHQQEERQNTPTLMARPQDKLNQGDTESSPAFIPVTEVEVNISRPNRYSSDERTETQQEFLEIHVPGADEINHQEFESQRIEQQPNYPEPEIKKENQQAYPNLGYHIEENQETSVQEGRSETYDSPRERDPISIDNFSEVDSENEGVNESLEQAEEASFLEDVPLPPERFYHFDGDHSGFREDQFFEDSETLNHNVQWTNQENLPDSWDEPREWQYTNSKSNPIGSESEQFSEFNNYQGREYSDTNVDHSVNSEGYEPRLTRRSEDHFSESTEKTNDTVSKDGVKEKEKSQSSVKAHSLAENAENKTSEVRAGRMKRSSRDGMDSVYHLLLDICEREGLSCQIKSEEDSRPSRTLSRKMRSVDLGIIFEMIKFARPTPIVYQRAIQTLPKLVSSLKRALGN